MTVTGAGRTHVPHRNDEEHEAHPVTKESDPHRDGSRDDGRHSKTPNTSNTGPRMPPSPTAPASGSISERRIRTPGLRRMRRNSPSPSPDPSPDPR